MIDTNRHKNFIQLNYLKIKIINFLLYVVRMNYFINDYNDSKIMKRKKKFNLKLKVNISIRPMYEEVIHAL